MQIDVSLIRQEVEYNATVPDIFENFNPGAMTVVVATSSGVAAFLSVGLTNVPTGPRLIGIDFLQTINLFHRHTFSEIVHCRVRFTQLTQRINTTQHLQRLGNVESGKDESRTILQHQLGREEDRLSPLRVSRCSRRRHDLLTLQRIDLHSHSTFNIQHVRLSCTQQQQDERTNEKKGKEGKKHTTEDLPTLG